MNESESYIPKNEAKRLDLFGCNIVEKMENIESKIGYSLR